MAGASSINCRFSQVLFIRSRLTCRRKLYPRAQGRADKKQDGGEDMNTRNQIWISRLLTEVSTQIIFGVTALLFIFGSAGYVLGQFPRSTSVTAGKEIAFRLTADVNPETVQITVVPQRFARAWLDTDKNRF